MDRERHTAAHCAARNLVPPAAILMVLAFTCSFPCGDYLPFTSQQSDGDNPSPTPSPNFIVTGGGQTAAVNPTGTRIPSDTPTPTEVPTQPPTARLNPTATPTDWPKSDLRVGDMYFVQVPGPATGLLMNVQNLGPSAFTGAFEYVCLGGCNPRPPWSSENPPPVSGDIQESGSEYVGVLDPSQFHQFTAVWFDATQYCSYPAVLCCVVNAEPFDPDTSNNCTITDIP